MIANRTEIVRAFCHEMFGGVMATTNAAVAPITPIRPTGLYATLGPRTLAHLNSTGANGYPSPSEADAAAAAALIASGHTEGEALALLLDSPRGQDALARKGRHGDAYLSRTVAHAAAFVGPVVERGGVRVQYSARPWRPREIA